ncbi:MAG: hypothetical protein K8M05_11155 [Deltaproteobacteria bacterium]|nr:hypothetical protein [Kofleriaceae bacterium]
MSKSLAFAVAATALFMTAAPAHAGDGTNLLTYAPESSQIVMVFDVADARDSSLLQKGFDMLLAAKPEAKAKLDEIGIDPMKDIDTVMFAGVGQGDDLDDMKQLVIVAEGRFPIDKIAGTPGVKKSTHAGVTYWSKDDTELALIKDRLVFAKKGQMKATIDVALNKGKGKGKSAAASKKAKALRDAIATTDTTADLWMTVLIPESAKKDMKQQGMSADTVALAFNFTADVQAALKIRTDSDATAANAVSMIQGQLAQVTQMASSMGLAKAAKSLLVSQDKAFVNVSLTLTQAELMALANLAGMGGGASAPPPPPPPTKAAPATKAAPKTKAAPAPKAAPATKP